MKVCPECDREYDDDVDFCARDGSKLRARDESSEDPLIGRMLDGQWRIEEKIGEGGMGAIYLASQESVGREVAIKTLRTALSENEEFAERFMREARVTSSINHPHCVTIFDFGQTENNTLYLAMEFLDGEPLADRMDRGSTSMRTAFEVGIQVASALSAAHRHEVVHRDLKPDNIFLLDIADGSTFTKVLDFGISKELGSEDDLTQTGQIFGTPQYMSPEQARGADLDARSDLYSLGCILYEMVSGRPPFDGDKSMEILVAHVQEEVVSIREVSDREVPSRFADLIMGLLEKDREARPARAEEVRGSLEGMFEDLVGSDGGKIPEGAGGAPSPDGVDDRETPGGGGGGGGEEIGETNGDVARVEETPSGGAPATPAPESSSEPSERRAAAPGGNTRSQEPDSWVDRNNGLVIAVVGLTVVAGILVVVGGGYFAYRLSYPGDERAGAGEPPEETARAEGESDETTAGSGREAVGSEGGGAGPPGENDSGVSAGRADAGGGAETAAEEGAEEDETAVAAAGGRVPEESDAPAGGAESPGGAGEGESGSSGSDGESASSESGSGESGGSAETGAETSGGEDGEKRVGGRAETGEETAPGGADDGEAVGRPTEGEPDERTGEAPAEEKSESEANGNREAGGGGPDPASFVRRTNLSATGAACKKSDVQRRLSAVEGRLGDCYRDGSGSGGSLMLEWTISTEGSPLQVSPLTSDVGSTLRSCAIRVIEGVTFAKPSGGRCYTRATFDFGD